MATEFTYPVKLKKQAEGGYLVTFHGLPEAITQAETVEGALLEASDCLEEAIANRMAMKLAIPRPSKVRSRYKVSLHATLAAKAALYTTMREKHLNNVTLAKQLQCDEKEVRRLIDPHYLSKLPRIEAVLEKLGKRLEVSVRSA